MSVSIPAVPLPGKSYLIYNGRSSTVLDVSGSDGKTGTQKARLSSASSEAEYIRFVQLSGTPLTAAITRLYGSQWLSEHRPG